MAWVTYVQCSSCRAKPYTLPGRVQITKREYLRLDHSKRCGFFRFLTAATVDRRGR